jgi:hypothetical protein
MSKMSNDDCYYRNVSILIIFVLALLLWYYVTGFGLKDDVVAGIENVKQIELFTYALVVFSGIYGLFIALRTPMKACKDKDEL